MKKIVAQEIIGLIPNDLLDQLSEKHNVDHSVQKLKGKVVFQLFLYGVLNCRRISLRILEAIFASEKFQMFFQPKHKKIKHSSIGIRLSSINYAYFKNIFEYLVQSKKIDAILFVDKRVNIRKIDSTIVTLSSKLLKVGMDDHCTKRALKYTTEINQGIPVNVMPFLEQKYYSEENALPKIVQEKTIEKSLNIAIFDRGIQSKERFVFFSKQKIDFISRLTTHTYKNIKSLRVNKKYTKTGKILSDEHVRFKNGNEKTKKTTFRVVTIQNKETKEIIRFITNIQYLKAREIADLYKSRWEIETFFKFIKQELNFSHLLSRSENGIRVVLFLTMITAILLTLYKRMNKIVGWTVAKIRFIDELESHLIREWHTEISSVFYPKKTRFSATIRGG